MRNGWLGLGMGMVVVELVMAGCGSVEGPAGVGSISGAILAGSNFEGNDGNLVVNGMGNQDWNAVTTPSALVFTNDRPSGANDNSFGQGSKEDDPAVSVVTGSIPPSKSDLTRFYVYHENVGGNFFLDLAWERNNSLGTATMDFEFNQAAQPLTANSVGKLNLVRNPGDFLITFDFSGSGSPTLGLLRWATSTTVPTPTPPLVANVCFSSNTFPCWADRIDLSAAGFAEGAVNTVPVLDTVENPPITVPANEFGEAAINLTLAGIFPPGQCVNFASVFVKSRSSTSFTSELKDFIAPNTANISNCGQINIHKEDNLGNPFQGANFGLFAGVPSGTTCTGNPILNNGVNPPVQFTCQTNVSGNCQMTNVPFGTYCVAEIAPFPPNFFAPNAQPATISNQTPTILLNFVNQPKPGAIKVTKNDSKGRAMSGVSFTVSTGGMQVGNAVVTDANGVACFTGLSIGTTYSVRETVPTGYTVDGNPKNVTVTQTSADCSVAPATVTFTNTPTSTVTMAFTSNAQFNGGPATSATVTCTGPNGFSASQNPFGNFTMGSTLVPGIYNCTIDIDP